MSLEDIQNYGEIELLFFSSIIGSYSKYSQIVGQGQRCWIPRVLAELRAAENDQESKTGLT